MSAATSTFRASVTAVDAELITQLHAAHGSAIFDFARHLGLNDEEAADVLQEAMLRFSRELVRGTVIERPPAWIYRTAYRLAMGQHSMAPTPGHAHDATGAAAPRLRRP